MFSIIISDLFSALGKAILHAAVAGAIIFGWLWACNALADAVETFFSGICWY